MAKHSKNTEQLILRTARKLYYRQGFLKTSLESIASECDITKPLITYHFGSKAQLGCRIYGDYSMVQYECFDRKLRESGENLDFIEKLCAYTLLTLRYYLEDERAFRFYAELFSNAFEYIPDQMEMLSSGLTPFLGDETDAHHVQMIYIGTQYAFRGLIYHYITNTISCPQSEFEKHLLTVMTPFMHLDQEQLDDLHEKALSILDRAPVQFLPEFRWN